MWCFDVERGENTTEERKKLLDNEGVPNGVNDHVHAGGLYGRSLTTIRLAQEAFWAGFLWTALTSLGGYGRASFAFWSLAGLGAGLGVSISHILYYSCVLGRPIEAKVPLLVGTAAFSCGFCWQPMMNLATGLMHFTFFYSAIFVGIIGALVFLTVLRLFRIHVTHPDKFTLALDATLALAIMGQEAFFACSQSRTFDDRNEMNNGFIKNF